LPVETCESGEVARDVSIGGRRFVMPGSWCDGRLVVGNPRLHRGRSTRWGERRARMPSGVVSERPGSGRGMTWLRPRSGDLTGGERGDGWGRGLGRNVESSLMRCEVDLRVWEGGDT